MGKTLTIIGLILFVIALAFIFPESLQVIFQNKLYTLIAAIAVFLIAFAIFIKIKER